MKATIVIPHAERHPHVRNTLLALSEQGSERNFDVVVVDYGPDSSLGDSLPGLGLKFPLVYRHIGRTGSSCVAQARNEGARLASGELLVFLDCDIVVGGSFVRHHLRTFQHLGGHARVLQLGTRRYLKPGNFDYLQSRLDDFLGLQDERLGLFATFSENFGALRGGFHLCFSNNIALPKAFFDELGGFDEGFKGWGLEDCELGYRVVHSGGQLVFNPLVGVFHQHHESEFDQARFQGYSRNLAHFLEKHRSVPATLQLIFNDFFDPELRARQEARGVGNVWADCYQRFEHALRAAQGAGLPRRRVTLKDPTLAQVQARLLDDPLLELCVLCSREQLELFVDLQLSPQAARITLHSY